MSSTSKPTSTVDQSSTDGASKAVKIEEDVFDRFDFDPLGEPSPIVPARSPSPFAASASGSHLPQGTATQLSGSKRSFAGLIEDETRRIEQATNRSVQPTETLPLFIRGKFSGSVRCFQSPMGTACEQLDDLETADLLDKLSAQAKKTSDQHQKMSDQQKKMSDQNQKISEYEGNVSLGYKKAANDLRTNHANRAPDYRRQQGGLPPTLDGSISRESASSQAGNKDTTRPSEAAKTENPFKRTRRGQ